MLSLQNLSIKLVDSDKFILKNINIDIHSGEIVILSGQNGSGKSSLVNAIMGNPSLEIASGKILLKDEVYNEFIVKKAIPDLDLKRVRNNNVIDLTLYTPFQKSLLGLFLANQYPIEIPGLSLMSFLRLIYNNRLPKEQQLPVFKFKTLIEQKAKLINYPMNLLERNLNEGFSGGEKKKTEILQMLVLEPRYIFLDEIDSGLDKESVKSVFEGIMKYKNMNKNASIVIITHYEKVFQFIKHDFIYEIKSGQLLKT